MIGIKKIEIKVNSNITENLKKVQKCLNRLIPGHEIEKNQLISEVKGIFGNTIKILHMEIKNEKLISEIISVLAEKLSHADKKKLFNEFFKRLGNKMSFYLRFKKSNLFNDNYSLYDGSDVIRIILYFFDLQTKSPKKLNPLDLREYLVISNIMVKE